MMMDGFAFTGYRSYGEDIVRIAPLKKINFLIGKNNVGKSNVINYLFKNYNTAQKSIKNKNNQVRSELFDCHKKTSIGEIERFIGFPLYDDSLKQHITSIVKTKNLNPRNQEELSEYLERIFSSDLFTDDNGICWMDYSIEKSRSNLGNIPIDPNSLDSIINGSEKRRLQNLLFPGNSRIFTSNNELNSQILNVIYFRPRDFSIKLIPAIRQIEKVDSHGNSLLEYSGAGLIDKLMKLQNPSLVDERESFEKFKEINLFLQSVLESNSAEIRIPHDKSSILVDIDGLSLPIENLGTGVHEILIIATAATLEDNSMICIEEPENHLHPTLQRKLIQYLNEKTKNQYMIATHSTHLLDAINESSIFHITNHDNVSKVTTINQTKEKAAICNDLGYKASALMQTNCIIWVEGPSDRIYVNQWIKAKNPDIVEGVHFSIMFYGGKLLSHLSDDYPDEIDSEIDNFISLRSLNKNSCIIIDSDREKKGQKVRSTKMRVRNSFENNDGLVWITQGREIENYLDPDKLENIVQLVHSKSKGLISKSSYSNTMKYRVGNDKKPRDANKVKVAKMYCETYDPDFSILDLSSMINKLVNFIKEANEND